MSRHGEITINWGDGEYTFRLGYGELRQLQEACGVGPVRIAAALRPYDAEKNPHGDSWRVEYIRETIRIGLIGGGMNPHDALSKTDKFVHPLIQNRFIAWAIIQASIAGTPDEHLGKGVGAKKMKARGSQTTKLPSDLSSETPQ